MLQESAITCDLVSKSEDDESGYPINILAEQLRHLERVSKSAFCKSNVRNRCESTAIIYYAKADYAAKTLDQLSLFKGDRVKAIDNSNEPNVLV